MDTGNRQVGPATLRVRRCAALPLAERENCREVANVEVPAGEQRKGYATTLMHKVCREADAAGIVLVLWPKPWGAHQAMSQQDLAAWYASEFGFVAIQPEPLLMARQPGATPRALAIQPVAAAAMCAVRGMA